MSLVNLCSECPLSSCDEESLWRFWRLVTKPNEAQKQILPIKIEAKCTKKHVPNAKQTEARRVYLARYYDRHRMRKLREARLRYVAKCDAERDSPLLDTLKANMEAAA